MISYEKISRILGDIARNPSYTKGYLRQAGRSLNIAIDDQFRSRNGTPIVEKDWDTLLILDACRFDTFVTENDFSGTLSKEISRGSTSIEFLTENFGSGTFHDIVYVSANPFTSQLAEGTFHDIIPVYDQWDDDLQTVPPDAVTAAVREAHEKYPDKRIIGHYMQPHYPFIGPKGQRIDHRGYSPDLDSELTETGSIWRQLQFGTLNATRKEVLAAYRENLRIVLESIEPLLDEITGKVVLTADHGNLIGERMWPIPVRVYGHPGGSHAPGLIEVPWFEIPFSSRRTTTTAPPVQAEQQQNEGDIEDRLRALGYR